MASSIRATAMGLPRVSMARIPLVAFANSHIVPVSFANSAHPSAYSSMSPTHANQKEASWANNAKKMADKLEHSAQKMASNSDKSTKDYLHEVKQFENAEDELLKDLGLATAPGTKNAVSTGSQHDAKSHNHSGGKGDMHPDSTPSTATFEQTLVDQVEADVIHPAAKKNLHSPHHQQEMISSLIEELKADKQRTSNLSQHASDAIRMVESHSVLKQDRAPIHAVREDDAANHKDTHSSNEK
ncbi:hypothetical protein EDD11_002479 [Mortierella claussenii]|nr:hypothetical protein EDD11_002479 [Mortierella claussenii]